MRTNVQDTSIESYEIIKPDLGEKQGEVLEIIEKYPNLCNYEIAEELMWDINTVTPRCKELRDFGLVFKNGKKVCEATNRKAYKWVSRRKMLQIAERDYERFVNCIKNDLKIGHSTPIRRINEILRLNITLDDYLIIIDKYNKEKFNIDDFKKLKGMARIVEELD